MLLGIWDNIEDLESKVSLDELQAILTASHDRDHRNQRFLAAIQGIDIDKGAKEDAAERLEAVKMRAAARLQGRSVEQLEYDELGLEVEIEE